jgi:hypothetical protein
MRKILHNIFLDQDIYCQNLYYALRKFKDSAQTKMML